MVVVVSCFIVTPTTGLTAQMLHALFVDATAEIRNKLRKRSRVLLERLVHRLG
jgi:hypothetical protein